MTHLILSDGIIEAVTFDGFSRPSIDLIEVGRKEHSSFHYHVEGFNGNPISIVVDRCPESASWDIKVLHNLHGIQNPSLCAMEQLESEEIFAMAVLDAIQTAKIILMHTKTLNEAFDQHRFTLLSKDNTDLSRDETLIGL
ncbi:hypothetical protein [Neptuniibacter sp. QD37_11]|uniref:hypothetical protein n=1 Tax=Neptuniibacter sp. QD37_11 TaxID=3398209 RepID=UPI0039F4629D